MKEKESSCLLENYNVAEYVHRWGNAASIALLDPSCSIFTTDLVDGVIGYRFASQYAVVFGDPVCPVDSRDNLMKEFNTFCSQQGKSVIYIATSEPFMQWSMNRYCGSAIECGNEIILDPCSDPTKRTGKKASLLRNKYNQSIREGIHVQEYCGYDEQLEEVMQQVRDCWLQNRKGPQLYLLQINMFTDREHKRWFYAKHEDRVVGVVMLNRIDAYNGWVLNILMVMPDAPTTTSEFLILSTLAILREEECPFFSIGMVPREQLGRIEGLSTFSQWLARHTFTVAKRIFRLDDRERYWKKFHPSRQPTFVLFSKSHITIAEVIGICRALNART